MGCKDDAALASFKKSHQLGLEIFERFRNVECFFGMFYYTCHGMELFGPEALTCCFPSRMGLRCPKRRKDVKTGLKGVSLKCLGPF
jgi:hypothetical protein